MFNISNFCYEPTKQTQKVKKKKKLIFFFFKSFGHKKIKKVIIIIMTSLISVMSTILAFFLPITLFTEFCDYSKWVFENYTAFRHQFLFIVV